MFNLKLRYFLHELFYFNTFAPLILFALSHPHSIGELAQLARAIAWHAIGQGFDSPILHKSLLFHSDIEEYHSQQ
jgi:hypothetical protein